MMIVVKPCLLIYMDNLIITTNDLDKMGKLYLKSKQRMKEGYFIMKYNSNDKNLNAKLIANADYVQHRLDREKVLSYLYDPVEDTLSIKIDKINTKANTKREILAEVSKVFNPVVGLTCNDRRAGTFERSVEARTRMG